MQSSAENLWLILATFLVLLMQCGFLMLEGGRVRAKNSINVAQKNIAGFVVAWVAFLGIGFYLMYGMTVSDMFTDANAGPLSFVWCCALLCMVAMIVSGATAERTSFSAHLVLVAVLSLLVYPVIGRLAWGNAFYSDRGAPLAELGFIDFSGSTVVHGTGAWFGLVALVMAGPRIGRFDAEGKPLVISSHNAVIALAGVLVLMVGWLGFNGGSVSAEDPLLQQILFNTLNAGVFGALLGLGIGGWLDGGIFLPSRVTTGLLGGLVASSAGIHLMSVTDAMLVGAVGGVVATYGAYLLLHRWRLDDPMDVVAVHGGAGIFGTLAVALIAPESALVAGSRWMQLAVQGAGVAAVFALACLYGWVSIQLIKRFMTFRVPEKAEKIGLNYTEHAEFIDLCKIQPYTSKGSVEGASIINDHLLDIDDEHSELAATLKRVVGQYEQMNDEVREANLRFQQFAETATDWLWETNANLSISFVHASAEHSDTGVQEAIVGRNLWDILVTEKSTQDTRMSLVKQRLNIPVFESELRPYRDRDTAYAVEVRGVVFNNSEDEFCGYRGTITDISERKTAEARAIYLSLHDELTSLPNRRALGQELIPYLQSAERRSNALVVAGVDLDGFKGVNDVHGHQIGDALLQQVAQRLVRFLRPTDTAYRTGGDEFVILLTEMEQRGVGKVSMAIMQRLIEELSAPYAIESLDIRIGASIGIAVFPEHDATFEGLQRQADCALYAAKANGKGCVVYFDDSLEGGEPENLEQDEQQLKKAG